MLVIRHTIKNNLESNYAMYVHTCIHSIEFVLCLFFGVLQFCFIESCHTLLLLFVWRRTHTVHSYRKLNQNHVPRVPNNYSMTLLWLWACEVECLRVSSWFWCGLPIQSEFEDTIFCLWTRSASSTRHLGTTDLVG